MKAMKLKIGMYEIEIKARHDLRAHANEEDTLDFLNRLSLDYERVCDGYKIQSKMANDLYDRMAKRYEEQSSEVYEFLDGCGAYDEYRGETVLHD